MSKMICEVCGMYWTPPIGWYLTHPREQEICALCLARLARLEKKEVNEDDRYEKESHMDREDTV